VVAYDSQYTADGAAAGSNAFASQDIKVIIGPVGSPETTGIKPVAARNEQLAWNAAYAKNSLEPKYPLMFHVAPGPAVWSDIMIKHVIKTFPMQSVALVAPNDQAGTDIVSVDGEAYRNNGIKTTEEYYQRGTTNFAPIVNRILGSKPDVVDTASSPPGDAGVIVKQLRLAGFTGPVGRLVTTPSPFWASTTSRTRSWSPRWLFWCRLWLLFLSVRWSCGCADLISFW
jgi:branched-chain amino acid transport system substrate-binding protein